MDRIEKRLYIVICSMFTIMITAGFVSGGFIETVRAFITLQTLGARLIQDFTYTHVGAALVNSALVGICGLVIVFFSEIHLAGPTMAAILTLTGFGLFGNTPFNSIPIILGVWIAAVTARKTLGAYSIIAIFGTALAPIVTYLAFELFGGGLWTIVLGIAVGLVIGFLLPAIAGTMLLTHQGYNLYNIGFSCGFLGLFIAGLLKAAGRLRDLSIVWNETFHPVLYLLIPFFGVMLIVCGFLIDRNVSVRDTLASFVKIQKLPGRLPSDFIDMASAGGTLVNMGLLALASWTYAAIIKAPMNGPVLGGMLTIIGFGGFGKSLKNCWPVMAGTIIATLVFGKSLTAPGPILAALFCTTLAPVAGQFGIIAGLLVGFIHLTMVETTAIWHGGLDLYNNGFAGGLTATLFIAFMQWYRTNRPREDFEQ